MAYKDPEKKLANQRAYRKTHPYKTLSDDQRRKDLCRSFINKLVSRGEMTRLPCAKCGEARVQGHHPDCGDPYRVIWLCKLCHRELHREEKVKSTARDQVRGQTTPVPSE